MRGALDCTSTNEGEFFKRLNDFFKRYRCVSVVILGTSSLKGPTLHPLGTAQTAPSAALRGEVLVCLLRDLQIVSVSMKMGLHVLLIVAFWLLGLGHRQLLKARADCGGF